ncbi:hypothetical protein FHT36_001739 [Xanthobacter sp. SG618]|nr:hypothetical protein [Xanthobacter sp. SG618]NMN57842.1 hypothetical protein [Xanthobacter sp. SG618]
MNEDPTTASDDLALLFEHAALVTAKPLTFDTDTDTNQTKEN